MENLKDYHSAKKRIKAKMGFFSHLSVFAAVIVFLAIINFTTSPGTIWFHRAMPDLGHALAILTAFIFVFPRRFAVTEQMIEKEMDNSKAHP